MVDTLEVQNDVRVLKASADVVDLRDRFYEPALVRLPQKVVPTQEQLYIDDQGQSSACTGFALAAVIDRQIIQWVEDEKRANEARGHDNNVVASDERPPLYPVSRSMLFEMAKLHDDLPASATPGSTLRGALKGFFHNGVCREELAPFAPQFNEPQFSLTMDLAEDARNVSLGAYYRLNHEINDYHAAIAEAGAVIASGKIHRGWANPENGQIELRKGFEGRHAFAIVGYDAEGFLVQNSWGPGWSNLDGLEGVARWTYDDWFENVEDAWVLRLAISSPRAFRVKFARNYKVSRTSQGSASAVKPRRQDIAGHFLHFDDGEIVGRGRYAQQQDDIDAMKDKLSSLASGKQSDIRHVLFAAHGAMQSRTDVASRVQAWRDTYLAHGIYPIHVMWETGFNSDVINVLQDLLFKTRKRMNKGDPHIHARLEELARPLGRKLWRDLQTTARLGTSPNEAAGKALGDLMSVAGSMKLHFMSQSAGVFLFSRSLQLARSVGRRFENGFMLAPACSVEHYKTAIRPFIGQDVQRLLQYSLIERRENEDKVEVYGKSLLHLVANALEDGKDKSVLGLQDALKETDRHKAHRIYYAGRDTKITDAKGHRGFDKDRRTMNHILETITGEKLKRGGGFAEAALSGY